MASRDEIVPPQEEEKHLFYTNFDFGPDDTDATTPLSQHTDPTAGAKKNNNKGAVSSHDLIVAIDGDNRIKNREYIRNLQQHCVLAPIAKRHPIKQRQIGRAVWWWLWLAVFWTLIIVASLYHNESSRQALATNRGLWECISISWIVVSVVAYVGWLEGRGVWAQAGFVFIAVVVQGIVLATLASLFFHRIGMFAVVFFVYLLTSQALYSLCPCSGHFPSAGIVVFLALAIVLVLCLVVPLHNASDGWISYPYGSSARWLEPPLPVWQAYVGALLGTVQMLFVAVVYINLTREHDESQTLFIVGRLYLVVVYGWKIMWYTLATRGCRGGLCCNSLRR
jgi:hypothetical protein